ncbi:hypothetical protein H8E88_00090 [candidate division KSB1 bacterium]|nr:hypothetical protein [candidate division KSB1 bacterium]
MNTTTQILLTAFGGFVVFTIGQITVKFFIEPVYNYKLQIGKIIDALIYYANIYTNPGHLKQELMDEASEELRRCATSLMSKYFAIPFRCVLILFRVIKSKPKIYKIRKNLIGLSNSVYKGDPLHNDKMRKEIENILKIKTDG